MLHQPERGLLLSGDHLLGRVSLFYDYGYTPDPVGEFLHSLEVVGSLEVSLVLAGHGRPVREARSLVAANRREIESRLSRVRQALAREARSAFEILPDVVGGDGHGLSWGLTETLSYLRHLEVKGELRRLVEKDGERWTVA